MKRTMPALLALSAQLLPAAAQACPFCLGDEQGANPIREGIFNETFWPNLGAMSLPFVVMLALVCVIYLGGSHRE